MLKLYFYFTFTDALIKNSLLKVEILALSFQRKNLILYYFKCFFILEKTRLVETTKEIEKA